MLLRVFVRRGIHILYSEHTGATGAAGGGSAAAAAAYSLIDEKDFFPFPID